MDYMDAGIGIGSNQLFTLMHLGISEIFFNDAQPSALGMVLDWRGETLPLSTLLGGFRRIPSLANLVYNRVDRDTFLSNWEDRFPFTSPIMFETLDQWNSPYSPLLKDELRLRNPYARRFSDVVDRTLLHPLF